MSSPKSYITNTPLAFSIQNLIATGTLHETLTTD
jgi:hypothetical protein